MNGCRNDGVGEMSLSSHDERYSLPVESIPPMTVPKNFSHFFILVINLRLLVHRC